MQILSLLVVSGFAIFGIFLVVGHWLNIENGKKVVALLKRMDGKYDDFIQRKMILFQLEDAQHIDKPLLVQEVMAVLEPEIQQMAALAQYIKTPSYRYQSRYFQNVSALADTFFHQEIKDKTFTEADESRFFAQTRSAIESDVQQRELTLKIGGLN